MAIEFNDRRRNDGEQPMGSKRKPGKGPKRKGTSDEKKAATAKRRASLALIKHVDAQHTKRGLTIPGWGLDESKVDKEAMSTCATCAKLKSNLDKLK